MKRFLLLSISALLFAAAYSTNAHATGGGYTSTKHGGASIDPPSAPAAPCGGGVNRSRQGPAGDYAGGGCASANTYYAPAEAGTYVSGECAHCHEPHASFGGAGVEPPPTGGVDTGPDPYLLMKDYSATADSYINLCWYCHENMTLNGNTIGHGYWDFYKGGPSNAAGYQTSSHYVNALGGANILVWPGTTGDTPTDAPGAFPRQSRTALAAGNVKSCLNCHTPHGVSGTYDTGTAPANAALNFSVSTAAINGLIPRQLIAREEALCLRCHDSSGPASTDVKSEADQFVNNVATTSGSGHPIRRSNYYNRHNLANENNKTPPAAGWFTSGSSHAECVDCHNPHTIQGVGTLGAGSLPWAGGVFQWSKTSASGQNSAGALNPNRYDTAGNSNSSPVKLALQNIGVWGLNGATMLTMTSGAIAGAAVGNLTTTNRVYDLCFKCHSAWAWGGATGAASNITAPTGDSILAKSWTGAAAAIPVNFPLTDVAAEFATNNMAYHPVFKAGKNTPERSNVRNPAWCVNNGAATTRTYSSTNSCTTAAGARVDLINVTTSVTYFDGTTNATLNLEQTLSQNFVPPWLHTSIITCTDCHEDSNENTPRGPHGSARPFILRRLDTNISYTVCLAAGTDGACGSTTVIVYSALAGTTAENLFCWNCHRGDVYNSGTLVMNNRGFSRQTHPPRAAVSNEGVINADQTNNARGLSCLGCHGGGPGVVAPGGSTFAACPTCKLGNIHGNSSSTAGDGLSNRLIAAGGRWSAWTPGRTAPAAPVIGSCTAPATDYLPWTGCTQHTGFIGSFAANPNYDYR